MAMVASLFILTGVALAIGIGDGKGGDGGKKRLDGLKLFETAPADEEMGLKVHPSFEGGKRGLMGGAILKEAPEPHHGMVVVGLDGSEGRSHDLRDRFKGKVIEDAEDQGSPLLSGSFAIAS